MAHLSEDSVKLSITNAVIENHNDLRRFTSGFNDVCILRLPSVSLKEQDCRIENIGQYIAEVAGLLGDNATLITVGEPIDLVAVHEAIEATAIYQSWIAIKRATVLYAENKTVLPDQHFGALIHTRYKGSLRHTKTRIGYTYCPACDKTTKDYGGKKHIYHEYGTLMSDVWRDIKCDLEGNIDIILERFADFFGIESYKELRVLDCRPIFQTRKQVLPQAAKFNIQIQSLPNELQNTLLNEDCLTALKTIPDNSIDFTFVDPPYNLKKKYSGYSDDLEITDYFSWCDEWLYELARTLKQGRICAVLNIPLYAIRHFRFLETVLNFQGWIAWDALSFPVRLLMPAHYSILLFSKGDPRQLTDLNIDKDQDTQHILPLGENYCLRANCIDKRNRSIVKDRGELTNLWSDIHRLKHNTRRVDHPCQLPPSLMYRLISLFTNEGENVLDCFDGAGTTTLTAHQLNRNYLGIEKDATYHKLAKSRHDEINAGLDPFRKVERVLTVKNSPMPRMPKQKYDVPKKTLQLEVKRVSEILDRMPSREDMSQLGKYPIEYYDKYFHSWGEVCAAARNTGMSENRNNQQAEQLSLFKHTT